MKFVIAVAQPADGPRILEIWETLDEVEKLTGAKIELSELS